MTTTDNVPTYERRELLGQGTYGRVYKARNSNTGEWVALKRMWMVSDENGISATTLREVSILRTLDNPHVVKLKEVSHNETTISGIVRQELVLIFEFLEFDLAKYLRINRVSEGGLLRSNAVDFCYQILNGLQHCHANSVMHRDLKPQNILVSSDGSVKLADFGLGRVFSAAEGPYTQEIITLWYRSPEILLGKTNYSTAVDIWSVGCIFAEMLLGRVLFNAESEIEQLLLIFKSRGTPSEMTWPDLGKFRNWHQFPRWMPRTVRQVYPGLDDLCADLLEKMLQLDPQQRISARRALEHPVFDSVRHNY
mmetsp:Transcript_8392/g.25224  ORF Transcript_8392/g.25224 Transcript_8392/m.25224 type:complete len:309 (+) Transcript_8392:100-1026(+)|eukprot:CAMPEP_0198730040 /NCGR_PEP_ID=MMETSP1475-20131203/22478_1 /TAXON_ID= ORGANISM="Unidentified sp., Strain CCMP1999" /NCGR_SAMPLE_ID=MMETSP1475 /ASSEMBLY_ACC=CAM_ASM_001111 /LENGTH=308 /DNA_ID=CAMNT_0044492785 /DNA_START=81 /DNA_END=1007 /DNA_ORIENTATION=+